MTTRRCALVVTIVAGVALVLVAAWWVPWHPVPGGVPAPAPAGSLFSAEQIVRGEDYASAARTWSLLSLVIGLAVASVLGFSRWGAALMRRLPGPWWLRTVLGVLACSVVGRFATVPCSIMLRRHRLAHDLSTQSWAAYARDVVTNEAVAAVTTAVGLLVLIGVARRLPRAWPAVVAASVAALVVLGSFVYPLLVEPLFNHFEPLPDGELRTQILDLAEREGVQVDDVLVADASRRTTTLNAYVSGFGGTRRVVVYDNLVESLPRDQALSVIAHELAHARHGDVVIGTSLGALGGALGVGLLGLLMAGPAGRRGVRLGDPGVVPMLMALMALASVATAPVQNDISRRIETRADVDALVTTGDGAAFVAMQRTLALRSMADPSPPAWIQLWWGTHPTTLERVAIARQLEDGTEQ